MSSEAQIFSYEEALEVFPRVRDVTAAAVRQIDALFNPLKSREEMELRRGELESAANEIIEAWVAEISSLGCLVKGLWLVDWDSGDGYYCWRYPEESIAFFHSYEDGFRGRVPIN